MKTCFISCLLLVSTSALLTASDWPQWRGPQRNGQVAGPTWPDKLDTDHLRLVWRVEFGPSYSGPIVSGERVFTTETKDKKVEIVTAFDRHSGQVLWRAEWPGAVSVPFFAKSNGDWIRATPACDGESLFVAGMRDVLVCRKLTGAETWAHLAVTEDQVCVRELNALSAFQWESASRPSDGQTIVPSPFSDHE